MNELERILNLAGVSYEAPEKIEETTEVQETAEEMMEREYQAGRTRPSRTAQVANPEVDEASCGSKKKHKHEGIETEAVGEFADPILDLCDEVGCDPDHPVLADLIRYLDGDTIADFVKEFRSNHEYDNGMEYESAVEVESEIDEAPNEGNEFSGNRKAAIDAGEDEFEVDGKKYKVSGNKNEAIEEAEDPDYSKDNLDICDKCDEEDKDCKCDDEIEESLEVVEESPTMDTTQLITLLKNSGISEDKIADRLKVLEEEFGNTPEGVGETEPTVHGSDDNYNFAQAVNLSLKRYLDAADVKVQVSEHTKEDLTAKYLASKK